MSNPPKRRALGRGLSALLPNSEPAPKAATDAEQTTEDGDEPRVDTGAARPAPSARRVYFQAQIEDIHPNPDQPRKRFEEDALEELAQSIRAHGIIQPLIVRARAEGGYYLIAGERRWRASQRAGLHQVPVVVQDVAPTEAFERALVENLQRADLNAIEEAEAYRRLVDDFRYTQEQVAERVGKDRTTVANSLRLLRLPMRVRSMVEDGYLTMGHARALLALEGPDIEAMARRVADRKLSVRATEKAIRERTRRKTEPAAPKEAKKSASVRDLEHRLTRSLGAEVTLEEDAQGKGGRIRIRYIDLDDLDRLLERLLV
ncbi:ParB/RepB/Spo0J family partition protein [Haliangium sp.]|uniref:ParB/RepB/Spo0J family partition protein n=1 Tax=Haliangium sp. TaxID=2663208 RepID=UPI003D1290F1